MEGWEEGRKEGWEEGRKQILQQDHLGRRFPLKFKHFDAHQYNIDDKIKMPDDEGWRGDDDYYIFTSTNKVMLYIFSK